MLLQAGTEGLPASSSPPSPESCAVLQCQHGHNVTVMDFSSPLKIFCVGQVRWHEFVPWEPHGRRREPSPTNCLLTSTCACWCTNMQMHFVYMCLCVCSCICHVVCMYKHTHVLAHCESRGHLQVSLLQCWPSCILFRVSHWWRNSQIRLDSLAPGIPHLCLPSTGNASVYHHTSFFT